MDTDLSQKAISSALAGGWQQAVDLNSKIIKTSKKDIDALNRLARAYSELGELRRAKTTAQKVLKLDPFNNIATKSLKKWKKLKAGETFRSGAFSGDAFLEEPGKTKIVSLLHLGDSKLLAKLDSGDEVKLVPHTHRVSVNSIDGNYIGRLSDDLAARMKKLMRLGNKYKALVKSTDVDEIKIFIREVSRSPKITNVPSFSTEKIDYVSFIPPSLVQKGKKSPRVVDEEEE